MSAHTQPNTNTGEVNPEEAPVSASVEDAAQRAASVESNLNDFADSLKQTVRERPYATLAVAAGVGYVAAAGVPNFLLRIMVSQGVKLATGAIVGTVVANETS